MRLFIYSAPPGAFFSPYTLYTVPYHNIMASKENATSIKVLDDLMSKLNVSKTQDETNAASTNLAVFINGSIEEKEAPVK